MSLKESKNKFQRTITQDAQRHANMLRVVMHCVIN